MYLDPKGALTQKGAHQELIRTGLRVFAGVGGEFRGAEDDVEGAFCEPQRCRVQAMNPRARRTEQASRMNSCAAGVGEGVCRPPAERHSAVGEAVSDGVYCSAFLLIAVTFG
ncbi:hypothetical protein ACWEP2_45215 [Streptomyces sp. NPDC004279]